MLQELTFERKQFLPKSSRTWSDLILDVVAMASNQIFLNARLLCYVSKVYKLHGPWHVHNGNYILLNELCAVCAVVFIYEVQLFQEDPEISIKTL